MEKPRARKETLFNTNTYRNDRSLHGNISAEAGKKKKKKYRVVIAKKIQNGLNVT